jgi:hypothetical protein
MPQKNEDARRTSNCQLSSESIPKGCAVIAAKSSSMNVPSKKRKEDANQLIYLKRV